MLKKLLIILCAIWALQRPLCAADWVKIMDAPFYTALANTNKGLIAGEWDSRVFLNPYNGLKISKDVGQSWVNFGLSGRGITDIAADENKVFASTYYSINDIVGLFSTSDNGATWTHLGPNVSVAAVAVNAGTIYLGGFSHGLWVSQNNGQTFEQKIGTGFYGPKVNTIESVGEITLAGVATKTYKSLDKGNSWTEVKGLSGKQINNFVITSDKIYAGTLDNDGLYVSYESAGSWTKLQNFATTPVGGLSLNNSSIYAGKKDSASNIYSIYESKDWGNSWNNLNINIPAANVPATSLSWVFSENNVLAAAISGSGIYKLELPPAPVSVYKFLNTPWKSNTDAELYDKITSFFDHQYPLLGYKGLNESSSTAITTLNFFGLNKPKPEIYYSSHSGIDFALPYGTEVKAPAAGMASYYFCDACGYSIKIDHLNGYQTIYEHLQKDSLVTTEQNVPVFAATNIGKVGLTGNTNGPHLHFEVIKDSNQNNLFTDDFPHGRVDPFGWLDRDNADPWNGHFWVDAFGEHRGQESRYLWNANIPQLNKFVTPLSTTTNVTYDNKTFSLQALAQLIPYNFNYFSYAQPQLPATQQNLKYISNTSFMLDVTDTLKRKITTLPGNILISIKLSQDQIAKVLEQSLKLYFFDTATQLWKPLNTVWDLTTYTLLAETTHLSQFAVFGEATDATPPTTDVTIAGVKNIDGWYVEKPLITLSSSDIDLDKIFYSLDEGITWNEYTTPYYIEQNGFTKLMYRASDSNDNYEIPHAQLLKVNFENLTTKKVKISGATFEITQ